MLFGSLLKVGVGWACRFFCYIPSELPRLFSASLRLKLFTADKQESLAVAFYWTIEVLLEKMSPLGSPDSAFRAPRLDSSTFIETRLC